MFGVGFTEIIVICVVILIFLGPKELPRMAAKLGKFYRAFNSVKRDFETKVREASRDLDSEQKSIGQTLNKAFSAPSQAISREVSDIGKSIDSSSERRGDAKKGSDV